MRLYLWLHFVKHVLFLMLLLVIAINAVTVAAACSIINVASLPRLSLLNCWWTWNCKHVHITIYLRSQSTLQPNSINSLFILYTALKTYVDCRICNLLIGTQYGLPIVQSTNVWIWLLTSTNAKHGSEARLILSAAIPQLTHALMDCTRDSVLSSAVNIKLPWTWP